MPINEYPEAWKDAFDNWWEREGKSYDPDAEAVPWFDKRKALAAKAYLVATIASRNYVADQATEPMEFVFANGTKVMLVGNDEGDTYLALRTLDAETFRA